MIFKTVAVNLKTPHDVFMPKAVAGDGNSKEGLIKGNLVPFMQEVLMSHQQFFRGKFDKDKLKGRLSEGNLGVLALSLL